MRAATAPSTASRLMVMRSSPAARNARAIGSDNSTPLLVSATAANQPSDPRDPAGPDHRLQQRQQTPINNGSPPVSRNVCAPRRCCHTNHRSCCSRVSKPGGSSTSGQQYGQARLQRAVSDNRNTPMGRLRRSDQQSRRAHPSTTLPDLQDSWHSPTPLRQAHRLMRHPLQPIHPAQPAALHLLIKARAEGRTSGDHRQQRLKPLPVMGHGHTIRGTSSRLHHHAATTPPWSNRACPPAAPTRLPGHDWQQRPAPAAGHSREPAPAARNIRAGGPAALRWLW